MEKDSSIEGYKTKIFEDYLISCVVFFVIVIILMHFYLVRVGSWHGDEYGLLPHYQYGGASFYLHRVLGWSPRPVSELGVWIYAYASNAFKSSLIPYALSVAWLILFAMLEGALRVACLATRLRLLVAASIITFYLISNNPGEVFYWPLGAVAYVPTIGGISAICFVSILRTGTNDRICEYTIISMLIVVATSSEVGAMFCLAYSVLSGLSDTYKSCRYRVRPRFEQVAILIPLVTSASVFVIVLRGRVALNTEAGGSGHRLANSLRQGALVLVSEVFSRDVTSAPRLIVMLLFCIGLGFILSKHVDKVKPKRVSSLIAGLSATIYGSSASAQYQFGYNCCERQSFARTCLLLLGVLVIIIVLAMQLRHRMRDLPTTLLGCLLVLIAVGIPLVDRLPQLNEEYKRLSIRTGILEANEQAGRSPKSNMQFFIGAESKIVDTGGFRVGGTFMNTPTTPWQPENIMRFYDKREIRIVIEDPST